MRVSSSGVPSSHAPVLGAMPDGATSAILVRCRVISEASGTEGPDTSLARQELPGDHDESPSARALTQSGHIAASPGSIRAAGKSRRIAS